MKDLHTLDQYRDDRAKDLYGWDGDGGNGCFKVFIQGRAFIVIASDGGGWDHVSVSLKNQKRCPTWEEMCAIKDMFFDYDECVVQYHPPKSDYINQHQYCLHLWRCQDAEMPRPPKIFV